MKLLIGKYQGTICPEGSGYTGAIDLGCDGKGNRQRIKRKGRTKEIVKDKLRTAVNELEVGNRHKRQIHGRERRPRLAHQGHQGTVRQDDQRLQEPCRVQSHPVHRRVQAQEADRR